MSVLMFRVACLLLVSSVGLAQGPANPSLLAIERAYYAGEPAAGREALEALGEVDDVTRAWAL
ncbi:MAG: hypothetical protein F4Y71_05840 [Acidobacteria bacterium]|nr:hypothetical protein [Acidobacteriota bacterium]MYG74859.1 hypothetical protein [Acidobacteriota bacterium]